MKRSVFSLLKRGLAALALSAVLTPAFAAPVPPPPPPVVKLLNPDPIAFAPNSSGAFTILRIDSMISDLIVVLEIGGTAVNGTDYEELPGKVTIPAGASAVDLIVRPLPKAPVSLENKTVLLTLKTNASYIVGTKKPVAVTLVQDLFNNYPPLVTISSPANGAVVKGPVIELKADANDPEDGIASVSFFAGDSLVGVAATAPYTVQWTNTHGLRKYAVFAKAVDKIGQTSLSKPVEITVSNTLATVVLTAPKDGAVVPPGSIPLSATVTDSPGPVTQVNFLANGDVVGRTAVAPYTFSWQNVKPGHYQISAQAEDSFGVVGESAKSALYISNALPVVTITAPAQGAKYNVKNSIPFAATATDPDGTISRVGFYIDHKHVGVSSNAPYQFTWTTPTLGSHLLIARSYDTLGSAANSPGVYFVVTNIPPAVSLTSPINNQVFTLPASIQLSANVTPGDAPVKLVNFRANGELLIGTATQAPYQVIWSKPSPGNYVISAHAMDILGAVTISQPILIKVNPAAH